MAGNLKLQYMKIANWYNNNVHKYATEGSASFVAKKELDLFAKNILKGGTVLDIGSGLGQDTEYLSQKGYTVVGIDISKEMVKYALNNRKFGIFVNVDFFKTRDIFGEHRFNGLWASSSILTHISKKNFGKFFKEVKQLLAIDGMLGLIVRKDPFRKREILFNNFSKEEIGALIVKNGFQIIEIRELEVENHEWVYILSKMV